MVQTSGKRQNSATIHAALRRRLSPIIKDCFIRANCHRSPFLREAGETRWSSDPLGATKNRFKMRSPCKVFSSHRQKACLRATLRSKICPDNIRFPLCNTVTERMPAEGIEPTRSCDHWILSPARLPVPPRRRRRDQATKEKRKLKRPEISSALIERILPHSSHCPLCSLPLVRASPPAGESATGNN